MHGTTRPGPGQYRRLAGVGGDAAGTRFSPLRDITRDNVADLEVAWEYHTGDSSELRPGMPPSSFLATPVLYDNTLYFCSGLSRAFAVDAETGQERWVFDSKPQIRGTGTAKCRGVAVAGAGRRGAGDPGDKHLPCQTRVFMGTLDARLVAIDAATGEACLDFGERGVIDLRTGMGDIPDDEMAMTSPPLVIGDLVIQGAMVRDNQRADSRAASFVPGTRAPAHCAGRSTRCRRARLHPRPSAHPPTSAIISAPQLLGDFVRRPATQPGVCAVRQPGAGFRGRPPQAQRV
ncbi:MAG: hypothetical protein R3E50_06980 [Halioglobus sp.]